MVFYDLCVPMAGDPAGVISMLVQLEYDTVAVEHAMEGKPTPELEQLAQTAIALPAAALAVLRSRPKPFLVLNRLTVNLSDQKDAYHLNGNTPSVKAFDLVAVKPTTEKLWAQCCEKLDVDIIALDLSKRLPFFVKPKQVNVAIERGIYFEIGYSASIQDAHARRSLISNSIQLVRAARQKHILLSSQAQKALLVRGPYDVANLGRLFGLSQNSAKLTVTTNCRAAVLHGKMRKGSSKGALQVTLKTDLHGADAWKALAVEEDGEDSEDEMETSQGT